MGTAPDFEPLTWEEDWSILPSAFKTYTSLSPIALPADLVRTHMPALEAITASGHDADSNAPMPDRSTLAQVAYLANGLLHRRHVGPVTKRVVEFRTAGAPGGYYHLELYFVCTDLPDLPAGVYHYATQDHAFRQLRAGLPLQGPRLSAYVLGCRHFARQRPECGRVAAGLRRRGCECAARHRRGTRGLAARLGV
jgi:hypothetical protein